jgi:hypothetical protein
MYFRAHPGTDFAGFTTSAVDVDDVGPGGEAAAGDGWSGGRF